MKPAIYLWGTIFLWGTVLAVVLFYGAQYITLEYNISIGHSIVGSITLWGIRGSIFGNWYH